MLPLRLCSSVSLRQCLANEFKQMVTLLGKGLSLNRTLIAANQLEYAIYPFYFHHQLLPLNPVLSVLFVFPLLSCFFITRYQEDMEKKFAQMKATLRGIIPEIVR